MNKHQLKSYLLLITYAITFFILLQNFSHVSIVFKNTFSLFIPFIYGLVIAYILNKPYQFFYSKIFYQINIYTKKHFNYRFNNLPKVLSIISVYICVIIIIVAVMAIIMPQLIYSIETLVKDSPTHYAALISFIKDALSQFNFSLDFLNQLETYFGDLVTFIFNFIYTSIPNILGSIINITTGITNFIFGIIISVYFLNSKETLCRQAKQLTYAFLPINTAKYVLKLTHLTNHIFSQFVSGQLLEALILGSLCFIGMLIFGFPYALLVSIIIGISNIIPIIGPILGTLPTTFIILMANPTNPFQAIWFMLFIIILQQVDGNIIYPRVVGTSIGLPGLWVLFAILIFGGQFGLVGMIVGVPICAISYIIIREIAYSRLKNKNIPFSKSDE
ncbi:MAG: AI-2E family transporter [Cellulosilyticaceae bacterium]